MRNQRKWMAAIILVETIVIVLLVWLHWGGLDRYITFYFYERPQISEVILSENKTYFAEKNSKYLQRESLFMQLPVRQVDICFFGDSITQQFEWQEYYNGLYVVNRGIGSDTTEGMLARVDSVIMLEPKYICIMAGINDIAQGRKPEEIIESYQKLVCEIQYQLPSTQLIISEILPVTKAHEITPKDILAVNQRLEEMCSQHGIPYVKAYAELADESGYLKEEYSVDYVHLSAAGYGLYLSCLETVLLN